MQVKSCGNALIMLRAGARRYTAHTGLITHGGKPMQLVLIALIGVGGAAVVGLFGPLAIKAGRALQDRIGVAGSAAQTRRQP